MQIEFEVDGQRLIRTSEAYMISGSENFVECLFTFSKDWKGLEKWAVFMQDENTYKIFIDGNRCLVPVQCTAAEGEFTLYVVGATNDENTVATTSEKLLTVRSSSLFSKVKSYFQKVIEDMLKIKQDAEQVKQDTEQAKQDTEQAKQDAEQAKQDAEQAKQDAEQAKQDAEQAKQDAVSANAEIKELCANLGISIDNEGYIVQ